MKLHLSCVAFFSACPIALVMPGGGRSGVAAGDVTFSFETPVDAGGRKMGDCAVAVSYKLKKSDGSVMSDEIVLYSFDGGFVTRELSLAAGYYALEEFLVIERHVVVLEKRT